MRSRNELPKTFVDFTRVDSNGVVIKMPNNLIVLLKACGFTPEKMLDTCRFLSLYWKNYVWGTKGGEDMYYWRPEFDKLSVNVGEGAKIEVGGIMEEVWKYYEPWVDTENYFKQYRNTFYVSYIDALLNTGFELRFNRTVVKSLLKPFLDHYEEFERLHLDRDELKDTIEGRLKQIDDSLGEEYREARIEYGDGVEEWRKDRRYEKLLAPFLEGLLQDESFIDEISKCYIIEE